MEAISELYVVDGLGSFFIYLLNPSNTLQDGVLLLRELINIYILHVKIRKAYLRWLPLHQSSTPQYPCCTYINFSPPTRPVLAPTADTTLTSRTKTSFKSLHYGQSTRDIMPIPTKSNTLLLGAWGTYSSSQSPNSRLSSWDSVILGISNKP